jgi:hypothetical protein
VILPTSNIQKNNIDISIQVLANGKEITVKDINFVAPVN